MAALLVLSIERSICVWAQCVAQTQAHGIYQYVSSGEIDRFSHKFGELAW